MISTRGRYALRVLLDLAERRESGYVPMKEVAERQGISLKYIERILPSLVAAGYVEGVHGKGGGYRFTGEPGSIAVVDVLRLTEGDLAPVACLKGGAAPCPRAAECRTLAMWKSFYETIDDFFGNITLKDLLEKNAP